jgi:hypothetical protein
MRHLREVAQPIVDSDRLGPGAEPRGSDHHWQTLDQVTQGAIGLARAADDHTGAEVGQRRAMRLELSGGLMAASQVLGAGIVTEVYDAANALLPGHAPESFGRSRFYGATKQLLRTPQQGADAIVWLGAAPEPARCSGGFWHDRRERPTHRVPWTRQSAADRDRLWGECERLSDSPDIPTSTASNR